MLLLCGLVRRLEVGLVLAWSAECCWVRGTNDAAQCAGTEVGAAEQLDLLLVRLEGSHGDIGIVIVIDVAEWTDSSFNTNTNGQWYDSG